MKRRIAMGTELLFKEEVCAIVGAAMEVHNVLGSGFGEPVYQECTQLEMGLRGIPFEPQKRLRISYKGVLLQKEYFADLVCYGKIIVELKAIRQMSGTEEAQILNYLRATGLRVALLINFGDPARLDWHRYIF
jgi:GxxExxY protein